MGMYTKLSLDLDFKEKLPNKVINALKVMVGEKELEDLKSDDLPNHDLFKTKRWDFMLGRTSHYFPEPNKKVDKRGHLSCESEFKNYDNEIL